MQDTTKLYTAVRKQFDTRHHIAHGIEHVLRVARLARHIAEEEGYDAEEAEIAGLLHDIGRTVQEAEKDHGPAGVPLASEFLDTYTNFDAETKQRILRAIHDHSTLRANGMLTHIVQDADMLDGLGAIGIMRAYTSKAHLPEYDPGEIVPTNGARDTTIHAQIAWQLEWVDMMHTKTGAAIARKRGAYMEAFLHTVRDEAEGKDW